MPKKMKQKLMIHRITLANLNEMQARTIRGGTGTTSMDWCPTETCVNCVNPTDTCNSGGNTNQCTPIDSINLCEGSINPCQA